MCGINDCFLLFEGLETNQCAFVKLWGKMIMISLSDIFQCQRDQHDQHTSDGWRYAHSGGLAGGGQPSA